MAAYLPSGWPAGVHPPDSEGFEQTAVTWLLDVVPPDYRLHGVLLRHPLALAALARHHLAACVAGARQGYRTARTELGPDLPPGGVAAVLDAYQSEGRRLVATAQAVDLVGRALHGEKFVPQLSGARSTNPRPPRAASSASSGSSSTTAPPAPRHPSSRQRPGQPRSSTPRSTAPRAAPHRPSQLPRPSEPRSTAGPIQSPAESPVMAEP